MTTTEKTYVATLVAQMCLASRSQKGIKYFINTCQELGVLSSDVISCQNNLMSKGLGFKETMYATLRSMLTYDKKQAQQYFIKAALVDGSDVACLILHEIFEECNMFDHVIDM